MSFQFKGQFKGQFKDQFKDQPKEPAKDPAGSSFNWSLIGVPDHAGVMNVGGRIGASLGPRAFREAFARMKGKSPVQQTLVDQGDIAPSAKILETHRRVSDRVRETLQQCSVSVLVGGGHDHGFSHFRGIAEAFAGKTVGCMNIDAHLDVRSAEPVITSGSPFYLALESGLLKAENFVEFGIQSHCNAPELWNYVESKKIEVIPFNKVRGWKSATSFKSILNRLAISCDAIVISLDLDAVASAFAPGVSAPQAEGFTSNELIEMMEEAGQQEKVVSLGVFELNPLLDQDERTARLAATSVWHFVESRISASSLILRD